MLLCYVISRVFVTKVTLLVSQSISQSVAAATDRPILCSAMLRQSWHSVQSTSTCLLGVCRSLNLHAQQRADCSFHATDRLPLTDKILHLTPPTTAA